MAVHLRPAMHQRHARAMPPQIQRRLGGGVLASNYNHVSVVIRMRIAVIMKDFFQVFARNIQFVGKIVITRGKHNLARPVVVDGIMPVGGSDAKIIVLAGDRFHPFVLADLQVIMRRDSPIIFERLQSVRLRRSCREWNIANLEQLRRSKKHHVARIVINGIDEAALVDNQSLEPSLLSLNCTRHASGSRAHDKYVIPRTRPWLHLGARKGIRNFFNGGSCQDLHLVDGTAILAPHIAAANPRLSSGSPWWQRSHKPAQYLFLDANGNSITEWQDCSKQIL